MLTGGAPMVMPVVGALIVWGIDPTPLLREVGIDSRRMFSPSERFPDEAIQALWLRAPEYARRPDFGLLAAQLYRPGMFLLLDELVSSAETMREALVRGTSYLRLLHDVAELKLVVTPPLARIEFMSSLPAPMPRAASEFFMACLMLVSRRLSGVHEHPRAIYFRHAEPADTGALDALEEFFECPLHFSADVTHVVFPSFFLDLPVVGRDPSSRKDVEQRAQRELSALPESDDFLARLRLSIARELDGKEPSLSLIAKRLSLSTRTLRRRLDELGTSYSEQLDAVRQRYAARYLMGKEPLSEVARRLGFKSRAAFFRAHKRWTGLTPGELRDSGDVRAIGAPWLDPDPTVDHAEVLELPATGGEQDSALATWETGTVARSR
jgi:AraC-like DNA-binding protein